MKKILSVLIITIAMMTMIGCDEVQSSNRVAQVAQEELMKESEKQSGMPNITNFYEKKLAKKIFELRDDSSLVTYAYTQNMDGRYVFLGTCIGYGLPYSVQYTNPEVTTGSGYSLPQADPNGLFMPDGLSATWLILLDEETGEQSIIYAEPEIMVSQNKLPKRLCEDWSLPSNY